MPAGFKTLSACQAPCRDRRVALAQRGRDPPGRGGRAGLDPALAAVPSEAPRWYFLVRRTHILTALAIFVTAPLFLLWFLFVMLIGPIVVLVRVIWWMFLLLMRVVLLPLFLLVRR